jgi:hypothetical protein
MMTIDYILLKSYSTPASLFGGKRRSRVDGRALVVMKCSTPIGKVRCCDWQEICQTSVILVGGNGK